LTHVKSTSGQKQTNFTLRGPEFAMLLNATRAILSTEQAQAILAANASAEALRKLLKEAVEDGRAVSKW